MEPYKCIIIEDEPLAAEILQDYITDVPFLKLKKTYADAISALDDLSNNDIDVIFLDINLPKLKGLDFIQTLKNPPHIIITTAYHEYALQGYELNVVDYLLKPIEFSRFLKAANKLKQLSSGKPETSAVFTPAGKEYIFVNTSKKQVKIYFREILYIESLKEYVRIFTIDKVITTRFQLGQIEEQLPKNNFLRIHRSYIVSTEKINAYTSTEIEIQNKQLPIGRTYKEQVNGFLQHNLR
ncbi:LytR/AlgR family response regulator transcription factor [Pedobacter steynii]|uniref:DNA-binding response regulator n=1 Tax=Pedobacter steynii TaxID=430522 RepID=A0A1D7QHP7_9SPHI|nr:LytTR family DNA-binding domain-containing protein [Pedobacter steynii]AOM78170.1 DNA-binding response regulator [Pedobacter steynii]